MKPGNWIGRLGAGTLILGVALELHETADTRFVTAGGWIQVIAYLLFLTAGAARPRLWFAALGLAPFSFWLWLLALGH